MSLDLKRWAIRAQEYKFERLDVARKQAATWRTGLAAVTALLGVAALATGRDTVSELTTAARWWVVLLLGVAGALFVAGMLFAGAAASGTPDQKRLITAELLRDWTRAEADRVGRSVRLTRALAVGGVVAFALGVAVAWLGPTPPTVSNPNLVRVQTATSFACGEIVSGQSGRLLLRNPGKGRSSYTVLDLATVTAIVPTNAC